MYSTNIDGETVEFGTSGMLYRSNKLMYDRKTNTLWNQFIGRPALGPLAGSGIKLEILPVTVTTWGEWFAEHPATTVLDIDTGIYRPEEYGPEWEPYSIYHSYRISPNTMFPVWRQDGRLDTKGQLFGLLVNGRAKAYPLDSLKDHPVVNDSLGGQNLVVVSSPSGGSRAFQRGNFTFSPTFPPENDFAPTQLHDQNGRQWQVQDAHLVQVEDPSRRLPRIPSQNAYWFGWYSYYPDTAIFNPNP